MSDVKLDTVIFVRGVGEGEISPVAVGQEYLQVLSGLEFYAHPIGEAQGQNINFGRGPGHPEYRRSQGLARWRCALLDALGRNLHVGAWPRLAHQDRIAAAGDPSAMDLHPSCHERRLAGTANRLPAGIRERVAGPFCGIENGFVGGAIKSYRLTCDTDLECHSGNASRVSNLELSQTTMRSMSLGGLVCRE